MHNSGAEADAEAQQQQQLLLRVNAFVQEQRDEYVALPLEEQRGRGPLLLEDLLTLVLDLLRRDQEGTHSTDDDDSDGEDNVGIDGGRRGGPVRRTRNKASTTKMLHRAAGNSFSGAPPNTLPFAIRDVPALAHVAALQMRLTSAVMAAISTRAIVTVHDLETWCCAQEGVEAFAELGLGVGLQVLPVVQQYFQLRTNSLVFPVSARDVISFLLHDPAAREALLYGGGDARDLLNRFSAHYDRTVLRGTTSGQAPSAGQRGGLQNVRQLGIHVQDYAALLAALTQELASASRREQGVVQQLLLLQPDSSAGDARSTSDSGDAMTEGTASVQDGGMVQRTSREAAARLERNRGLYECVLQSFDAAVAQAELTGCMRRARERDLRTQSSSADTHNAALLNSAAPRHLDFTVAMSDSEARRYSVPLTLWRATPLASASASKGGVELCFRVGRAPEESDAGLYKPSSSSRVHETVDAAAPAPDSAPSPSLSPPPSSVVSGSAVRRRRGTVVRDVASSAATSAMDVTVAPGVPSAVGAAPAAEALTQVNAAAAFLSSLFAPAGSQGVAAATTTSATPPPASSTVGASIRGETAASCGPAATGDGDVAAPTRSAATAEAALTPLERLHRFLEEARADSGTGESQDVPDAAARRLLRLVAVLERFAAGDVVPASWVHEALTRTDVAAEAAAAIAPELRHRRFIPLLHPFATPATLSRDGGTAAASLSRLDALRQQHRAAPAAAAQGATAPSSTSSSSSSSTQHNDVREVVFMAAPCEVCWSSWLPLQAPNAYQTSESRHPAFLTCACLERQYPASLRRVVCDVLGVRAAPTVAAWCTAAAMCARRLCPVTTTLGTAFTEAYVDSFARCVDADMAARLAEAREGAAAAAAATPLCSSSLAVAQRVAESALRALLAAVQASLSASTNPNVSPWQAGLFPVDHAWRSALDGLLYATPRWCGYEGPLLTRCASATTKTPAARLHLLCLPAQEPSHAVEAVLHFFGVRPLAALVETRVSFRTTVAADASGVLHDKIATIASYVQGFCRTHLPMWYSVTSGTLRERLCRLRIVLTSSTGTTAASSAPVEALRLHWGGAVYAHERQVRLEYVAAHNIVYGTSDTVAVPVQAEALFPLFAPAGSLGEGGAAGALVQVRELLLALLGALSSLDSSAEWSDGADASPQQQQWRREQLVHVLAPVAEQYGFVPFTGAPSDPVFTLPSRPFARFQSYYPPGTDALRLPRGPAPSNTRLTPAQTRALVGRGAPAPAGRRRGGSALVQRYGADGRLRVTVPLPGSEGAVAVATSMPAWRSFPMELDVNALVSAFAGQDAAHVQAEADGDGNDAEADEASDSGTGESGEARGEESYLTFQYHRRTGPQSGGSGRALALTGPARGPHKRPRSEGEVSRRARRLQAASAGAAAVWLRPPASSAAAGTAGDTPDYAIAAERYVYELLRDEYATQGGQQQQQQQHRQGGSSSMAGVRVVWVNEHHEAGSPFDIIVLRRRPRTGHPDAPEWEVLQYVEVKSTCTASRPDFEMSMAELLFAARFGAAYCVYRVFGASTDALRRMRHRVYADVVQLWYKAQLTITADIRVSPST